MLGLTLRTYVHVVKKVIDTVAGCLKYVYTQSHLDIWRTRALLTIGNGCTSLVFSKMRHFYAACEVYELVREMRVSSLQPLVNIRGLQVIKWMDVSQYDTR